MAVSKAILPDFPGLRVEIPENVEITAQTAFFHTLIQGNCFYTDTGAYEHFENHLIIKEFWKMSRFPMSLVLMASIFLLVFGVSRVNATSIACDVRTTQVKVLVEHPESSSVYKYTVVNNHSHGITFLVLSDEWLPFSQGNFSINLKAPRGWTGELSSSDNHGHPSISFTWKPTNKSMAIKPGITLRGFELDLGVAPNPTQSSQTFLAVDDANKCWLGKVELKQ